MNSPVNRGRSLRETPGVRRWNLERVPRHAAVFLLSWWPPAAFLSSLPAFPHLWNRRVIISQEEMYIQAPCNFPVLGCFMRWCSLLYDQGKGPFSAFPWKSISFQKPWVKIKYISVGRRWSGHLLFFLVPIHANSTPFPFQEITSSSFCAFQGINSLMLVDCQSRRPNSLQPGGGLLIHAGPTGLPTGLPV